MARRTRDLFLFCAALGLAALVPADRLRGDEPVYHAQAIFPPEPKHNHASCVIQTAPGHLLAAWYSGSGERKADDVVIEGAWLVPGRDRWGPRFLMADTPGYPDCNPALFHATDGTIWLFWPTILDHRWEGALLKYQVAGTVNALRPISWSRTGVIHVTPDPAGFASAMEKSLATLTAEEKARYREELSPFATRSKDLLYQRLGWMPRVHPIYLPGNLTEKHPLRWILPLYSDTFSASIMVMSDDEGKTWTAGRPMIGFGNIQPSLVRKKNGAIVAYMRDAGPHRRIRLSTSSDDGESWSPVVDTAFPNPGAGIEAVRLVSGNWALVYNDTTHGRHSLAISLSDDEGATWKWTRHIERHEPGQGSYHYPSIIQGWEGPIHVTYTHRPTGQGSTIMHARFNEAWIRQGDGRP
jgi:predicted neuraminidase